jgi:acyl-coenzyme A synthetase/AMP-(fatty) acid ligase
MDLAERIRRVIALDPEAEAILFQNERYPWRYLSNAIHEFDTALLEQGIGEGASVGLIMRNRPWHAATLAATLVTGRALVTLSPMFSDEALARDIETLGLHAVLGDEFDLARVGVHDAAASAGAMIIELIADRDAPFRVVRPMSPASRGVLRPGIVLEMLSSGTTGIPKRIPLKLENLESSLAGDGAHAKSLADDSLRLQSSPAVIWNPIVHISGAFFVIDALYSGRRFVLMERFDARAWSDFVEQEKVRVGQLNPTAMRMILDADIAPERLSSLKVIRGGTSATPPELQIAFEDRYGVPVLTTYGATEFAGAIVGWSPDDHATYGRSHLGASGRAQPGVELRVVEPVSGNVLPFGDSGVLEVRTAQSSADPQAWIRTSDLAVLDPEGFLWIQGRVDDVIVRGGFKVHAGKVAAALEEHDRVREAAVVGLPDQRLGQVPVAVVTTTSGAESLEASELIEFVKVRLAVYEVPADIKIVDALPLTPSMKVSRPALLALFAPVRSDS